MPELLPIGELVAVPKREWPVAIAPLEAVYRSSEFCVRVHIECDGMRHLSVNRRDWCGGISWDELQQIKDALFPNREAVEVFPRQDEIVYDENVRHIWVFPHGYKIPFAWRDGITKDRSATLYPDRKPNTVERKEHEHERLAPNLPRSRRRASETAARA